MRLHILSRLVRRWLVPPERTPDFVIGDDYMRRWWVIPRNRWFNIYLHNVCHSDDDRALHDHPWWSLSLCLAGVLVEHRLDGQPRTVVAGDLVLRRATVAHRLELVSAQAWTLFLTGPRIREWGFHCPRGWVHWRDFTAPGAPGHMGRGCGEDNNQ